MSDRYLTFAVDLAKQAGAIIRKNFMLGMKREWKKDLSPLTETDKTINALVIKAVKQRYPEHGIIAEEGSDHNGEEYVWVCDPVDGTIPFSHGIPTCVFSLALVHDGKPILGAAYDPFMDRMYQAEDGKGARINKTPLYVSSRDVFEQSMVGMEAWESWNKMHGVDPSAVMDGFSAHGKVYVVRLGSIVYQTMQVANGEFVASLFPFQSPWDAAASKVIVEEAGGRFTDLQGNDQRYDGPINGFIASNGLLHDELVRIVAASKSRPA